MPEKLDPRILSIWEQEQQLAQRRKPKEQISRERHQDAAERQQQKMESRNRGMDSANKQKGQRAEVIGQDLADNERQLTPPKTTKDDLPTNFASLRFLETTKVSTTGTKLHSAGSSSTNKGLPSLYECAKRLKLRSHLICYMESLYVFNGKCYDYLSPGDVVQLYRDKVDYQLGGEKSLRNVKQLHEYLCTDSGLQINEIEDDQRIAVLQNGVFDVEAGKLRKHSDNRVVFSYVKANYSERGRCEYFHRFLECITHGDKTLQERLWQFLGYMLMQTTEGKAFFVMGLAPDSGKSVMGNLIESLFDKRYVSNIALNDFNRNFALAPIVGSAINISLDLPSTRLKPSAVSQLKMLTGGDTFTVSQKYMPEFSYRNRAKLLFASNFPIELYENDNAFWKRMVYLPFDYSISKSHQNTDLLKLLQAERDSIVSEALYHARALVENNFCFPTTPLIERRMEEWQGRINSSIEEFLHDCCVLDANYRGELTETLFSAYERYCALSDFVAKTRSFFKQFLENEVGLKHFKMRDGGENPQSAFRGIKIKEANYD